MTKKLPIAALIAICFLLAINHNYSYSGDSSYPALTSELVADPSSTGMTFSFSGIVINSHTTKQGLILLKVQNREKNLVIDVPIFPSVGKLERKPGVGDKVSIIGNLGQYKGKPQLQPLAAELVQIKQQAAIDPDVTHTLRKAIDAGDSKSPLLIGPLTALNTQKFHSKAGKEHLKAVVRDDTAIAEAVLWQGNWDEDLRKRLNSGASFYVTAKVGQFRGQPSLTVDDVIFDKPAKR